MNFSQSLPTSAGKSPVNAETADLTRVSKAADVRVRRRNPKLYFELIRTVSHLRWPRARVRGFSSLSLLPFVRLLEAGLGRT